MFSRSRGNLSDMKTRSFIWFADLFKHQNAKIDKKKIKKSQLGKRTFLKLCWPCRNVSDKVERRKSP